MLCLDLKAKIFALALEFWCFVVCWILAIASAGLKCGLEVISLNC